MRRFVWLFLFFCLLKSQSFAQEINHSTEEFVIEHISISGNKKTKKGFVFRELTFTIGDTVPWAPFGFEFTKQEYFANFVVENRLNSNYKLLFLRFPKL